MSQSVPASNESIVTLSYLKRDYQINVDQLKHLCETTGSENESEIQQWLEETKITDCQTMFDILDLVLDQHLIDSKHHIMFTSAASAYFASVNKLINRENQDIDTEKLKLPPVANITTEVIDTEFASIQENYNMSIFKAKLEKQHVLTKLKWSAALQLAMIIILIYLLWLIRNQNRQIIQLQIKHQNHVIDIVYNMNHQCDERLNYLISTTQRSKNMLQIAPPMDVVTDTVNDSIPLAEQVGILKTKLRIHEEILLWSMTAIVITFTKRFVNSIMT